jgi:hypothetical protein
MFDQVPRQDEVLIKSYDWMKDEMVKSYCLVKFRSSPSSGQTFDQVYTIQFPRFLRTRF